MPTVFNYAEEWQPELLDVVIQGSLTSPFITNNVRWLDAKTFHFTSLATTGFRDHSRGGGWNRGEIVQTDHSYTVEHDRDIEFFVDKADVDETNSTASIEKIAVNFVATNAVPETDARFFERVSEAAINANSVSNVRAAAKALNTYTKSTVIADLKGAIDHCRKYRNSLIAYVRTEIMSLLELALADKANIAWTTISDLEFSVSTRCANIDGVPVFEVFDAERFATKFAYGNATAGTYGFTKSAVASQVETDTAWQKLAGKDLNIVVASTATVLSVHKIDSIYAFGPGEHTQGDGWLYQHRELWDTFVFPNGKNNLIDSVYIEYVS